MCLTGHYLAGLRAGVRPSSARENPRCLYASAVNREGKVFLERIIRKADLPDIDFLVFCYDDADFDEAIFRDVTVVREKGIKWEFMKKYLTPERCAGYDYIFAWDDDIDPLDFSFARFVDIMRRNDLEIAQPGISPDSFVNVKLTRAQAGMTGRFTDYVENMVPVFTRQAWTRYWDIIEEGKCRWGWQLSSTCRSACGYRRMGIVDEEPVAHTRPCQSRNTGAPGEARDYYSRHPEITRALKIAFAQMR